MSQRCGVRSRRVELHVGDVASSAFLSRRMCVCIDSTCGIRGRWSLRFDRKLNTIQGQTRHESRSRRRRSQQSRSRLTRARNNVTYNYVTQKRVGSHMSGVMCARPRRGSALRSHEKASHSRHPNRTRPRRAHHRLWPLVVRQGRPASPSQIEARRRWPWARPSGRRWLPAAPTGYARARVPGWPAPWQPRPP